MAITQKPNAKPKLPQGATVLATAHDGRAYVVGDQLVIEMDAPRQPVKAILPTDPEWLWNWQELFGRAADVLAGMGER